MLDLGSLRKLVGKRVVVERPFRGRCSGELRSVSEAFLFLDCGEQSVVLNVEQDGLSVRLARRSRLLSRMGLPSPGAAAKRSLVEGAEASTGSVHGAR
ncbi:MAG: hypothetical protein ACETV0_05030 [Nitrososphaeria archaeon]